MGLFGPPNIEKLSAKKDIPALIKALEYQKDRRVRRRAAEALDTYSFRGKPHVQAALIAAFGDNDRYICEVAEKALVKTGRSAVKLLTVALGDFNPHVRIHSAQALIKIGDTSTVTEPLIALLGEENTDVRRDAANALGQISDTRAVEPLIALLNDDYSGIRQAAAEALGQIGEPAVAQLITTLQDNDYCMRKAAMKALVVMSRLAVEPLINALRNENHIVRLAVVEALAKSNDPRAVKPLKTSLMDENHKVRIASGEALVELNWQPNKTAFGAAYWIVKGEWDKCVQIGTPAVKPLITALRYEDSDIRKEAAVALGKLGGPHTVDALNAALKDTESNVRQAAASALGDNGDTRAVEPLIAALGDDNSDVRQAAASALGSIRASRAVEPLIAALGDEDSEVRVDAVKALDEISDNRAVEPLIAALRDEDFSVRKAAADVLDNLGWQPDEGSDGAAYWIARGEWDHCAQMGPPAIEPLIAALGFEGWTQRQSAAHNLGNICDPCSVEPLISTLGDKVSDVRQAAAVALVKFYQDGVLSEPLKKQLLENRNRITTRHTDNIIHEDFDRPTDCHYDRSEHHDSGIGVPFPV